LLADHLPQQIAQEFVRRGDDQIGGNRDDRQGPRRMVW
jgi:hypothetical protein